MARIFGFDIGTTSIGLAVIDHDPAEARGKILLLGVRIFPEARDPDGTPLNQQRRQKRMMRRQLRRRRMRRRLLNETLGDAGLLPAFGSADWPKIMAVDPYGVRSRGLTEALTAYEFGRALYHLAKRRHYKNRDLEEEGEKETDSVNEESADEKAAKSDRDSTLKALKDEKVTLGAWLANKKSVAEKRKPPQERRRGVHALRSSIEDEFQKLWSAQARYHSILGEDSLKSKIHDVIFSQRPVFWRKNTLGECRFVPGGNLCPKGAWLSQQKRMLEKLNNLTLAGGNARPLDPEERAAILEKLQTQASMSWSGVRSALRPLYKARGEGGAEKSLRFNLELGGDRVLLGNAVESKLFSIFGKDWHDHPHKQAIREAVHRRLWSADYGEIGSQRVVILSERERKERRTAAAQSFMYDFGISSEQAQALQELRFPTGWEPYSIEALQAFLPYMEEGVRFGALISGPEWEDWRAKTFPDRERPTGGFYDKLPSPAEKEERERIAKLRNPTVVRTQNELRKVVNNLIGLYGKPDLIRIEVAREVGKSKREREEEQSANRKQEKRRKDAINDLQSKGIAGPSRDDIEKWLLWQECNKFDPYSGNPIGFDDLFRNNVYQVEHIWPRSASLDNSFGNKTLCHRDWNSRKAKRTPYAAFGGADEWEAMERRIWEHVEAKRMSKGKAVRFCRKEDLPDDFASRQLNDTGYAARQAISFLKRLWPDMGPAAPVTVQAVTGRVTAQLRKLWHLNNILSDSGEKTRSDHRHHAIDALVVALTHPGMTNRLSRYWQLKDDSYAERPDLPPPWPTIRSDAERAVEKIIVSHRVRKKVSGPLHEETVYGRSSKEEMRGNVTYRKYVTRKPVEKLTLKEISSIIDESVRSLIKDHIDKNGGKLEKAFPPYPRLGLGGAEIRKVRVYKDRQPLLMVPTSTGYVAKGNNHHIAIYRQPDGSIDADVVSLFVAMQRLRKRESLVKCKRQDGAKFIMSISLGDTIYIPDGEKKGWWVARILSPNKQIFFHRIEDALGDSKWGPNPNTLMQLGAKKVSIDPIGRVRPAKD